MSSGRPIRRIGFIAAALAWASGPQAFEMSVSNAPGITRLARTLGAQAPASPNVSAFNPALAMA